MLKIHSLLHVPFEGPGHIAVWAQKQGHQMTFTHQYAGDSLPDLDAFDMLVIMGGPMGVYDEDVYPWLADEKKFIKTAISADKKVLGVCLGSQIIAEILGAKVYPNQHKEIGWLDVAFGDTMRHPWFEGFPKQFTTFHWHGDTFDLPAGATRHWSSNACKNQAFSFQNNVLALQFHFETTPESLNGMIVNCGEELKTDTYIQSESEIKAQLHFIASNQSLLEQLLNRFSNNH